MNTTRSTRSAYPTYRLRHLHDCRPENIKYKQRDPLYDASILSKGLYTTVQSSIDFNEKYHYNQRNLMDALDDNLFKKLIPLTVLESHDKIIKQLESGGDGELEYDTLNWPNAIACSTYGDILVCDTLNHRILVFNRDLVYKYKVGSKGNFNGQFDEPFDIAITVTNNLLIADKNNNRIELYEEHLMFQQSKTKINAFIRSDVKIERNEDNTIANVSVVRSSRSNSLQYRYKSTIELDDKPIKICTSTVTAVYAVSTIKGRIFVFNSANRMISAMQLNELFDIIDLRNICIHKNGYELIFLKYQQNKLVLRFYQFQNTLINKIRNVTMNKNEQIMNLNQINLIRTVDFQRSYLPGVSVDRAVGLKQTPDLNHLIIYDTKNLCILVYDLNGDFIKVLLRSFDYLEQLLAVNFSIEGHLLTCEYELRNNNTNELPYVPSNKPVRPVKSAVPYQKKYIFKIKIYRYLDCECHRYRPSITKRRISNAKLPKRFIVNRSDYF